MSYYDTPEQPIDPPEMSKGDEMALESAEKILREISKLHEFVEMFFEELSIPEIEKRFNKAEEHLEDLESLYNETSIVDEEYAAAGWLVEEIEGWLNERADMIKKVEDK